MSKIVTLGEIMLRLSPKGKYRFVQSDSFQVIRVAVKLMLPSALQIMDMLLTSYRSFRLMKLVR